MELMKETVRLSRCVFKGDSRVMAEGDIVVPDIKPDILKLLQADAVSCVTDTRVSDGRLDIEGRVDMTILYIPDCEGERIRSIDASFDFSHRADCKDIKEGMNVEVICSVARVEFSAVNSRKIRVKAAVALDFEVCGINETELPFEISGEAEIMREEVKLRSVADISTNLFTVKESMEMPAGQGSVNEVLKVDVRVSDTDYKPLTGKVVAKGVLNVCVLYTDENMSVEFTETEIPFTEVFDGEDISEDTICDIEYSIHGTEHHVETDNDGDRRIITLDISMAAQMRAEDEISFEMISDCYIPGAQTVIDQTEAEIEEVVASPSVQNTMREIVEFGDSAPKVFEVYNVITKASVQKAQMQRGKLLCEGKLEAYVLYLSESADNPVYSIRKEIPFSYMLECDTEEDGLEPQLRAEVRHTSYSLNSAGELELRCILGLSANIVKRRKINVIGSVDKGDGDAAKSGIVIYFVQNGDTLWDIAKRYAITRLEIMKFNNLEEEQRLTVGSRLFIP